MLKQLKQQLKNNQKTPTYKITDILSKLSDKDHKIIMDAFKTTEAWAKLSGANMVYNLLYKGCGVGTHGNPEFGEMNCGDVWGEYVRCRHGTSKWVPNKEPTFCKHCNKILKLIKNGNK